MPGDRPLFPSRSEIAMSHAARRVPSAHPHSSPPLSGKPVEPSPPAPVRGAFALWATAVAAGVVETVLAVGGMVADGSASAAGIAVGVAVRVVVFAAALLVAVRMRRGHHWARIALVLGLGVVGTASMVIGPVRALLRGDSLGSALAEAGAVELLFGASRVVHVAAVLTAVVLMFLPAANVWFRAHRACSAS